MNSEPYVAQNIKSKAKYLNLIFQEMAPDHLWERVEITRNHQEWPQSNKQ